MFIFLNTKVCRLARIRKYFTKTSITYLLVVLSILVPDFLSAQGLLEEIIVTAQRREQSLKDIPVSITAFSGESLEKLSIKDAQSYLALTPNVSFDEGLRRGSRSIRPQIRGIGNLNPTALTNAVAANSIGIYLDEVSIGFSVNGTVNPQLIDMERIEVLRGPQGTFFGLNAAAGALNLTSKRPDDKPLFKVMGELGNDDKWNTAAIANYPVSDTFMVRGVVSFEQTAALIKNLNPVGGDSSSDNKYFKLSARWLPTENLTVDATYSYSEEEQEILEMIGTGRVAEFPGIFSVTDLTPDFATAGALDDPGVGFFPNNQSHRNVSVPCEAGRCTEDFRNTGEYFSGKLDYDGGWYKATGIVGRVASGHQSVMDTDGTSLAALIKPIDRDSEAWSGELRLASTGEGPFEWLVGGFYFNGEVRGRISDRADADAACLPGVCFPDGFSFNAFHEGVDFRDMAIFGNFTWHVSDKLSASIGGRYTDDKFTEITFLRSGFGGSLDEPQSVTNKTAAFTPKLSVTYDWTDDVTTYASVSRGYKPGGVVGTWRNATAAETLATGFARLVAPQENYGEETLWNYEIGLRAVLFDNKLNVNLSAFKIRWNDYQSRISRFALSGSTLVNTIQILNAGDADLNGIELDFIAAPTERITFGGGVGYLDTEFRDFKTAFLESSVGPVDLTGRTLPGAPEWTSNAWGEYRMPLTNFSLFSAQEMEGFVHLQWRYRASAFSDFDAYSPLLTGKSSLKTPAYDVGDLRFGIENDKLSISAYVENILGKDYQLGGQIDTTFYNGINVRPHPRQWGIKFAYTFD